MARRPRTVEPGQDVLPGYRVVALLSHGRRVDTYDVVSQERDCRCVVKVLRPDRRHEQHVRDAVLREGTLLRELTHPHLVRGYEVHTEPDPAMVLQTLSGATLAAVVEAAPLDVPDSLLLGLQLTSALSYLHRHDWLHLDVKPANVVVQGGSAVLIDLSLVGRPGRGRPGAGTRGYLAPEQAVGEDLSAATDVWGLGVTLVECLTGDLPHGDEATWDSRRRLRFLRRPEPPPASLPEHPDMPPAYRQLLLGCLERRPAHRPTMSEVRACLTTLTAADAAAGRSTVPAP